MVRWDGDAERSVIRRFYIEPATGVGGFSGLPAGSAPRPKNRPRPTDVQHRRGTLSFGFIDFKNRVMPFVKKLSKYANMDDDKLTDVLYEEYKLAQKKNLL